MICARFGGDEFIIFGASTGKDDAENLEKTFRKNLDKRNTIVAKPYEIDASIGTIVTKIEGGTKLFSLITRADKLMYERKKKKKTSRYLRK
jgi:diguanylate cyclase (GGDEF)-like protein